MQNTDPYVIMVVGAVLTLLAYFASEHADDEKTSYKEFWEQTALVLLLVGIFIIGLGAGAYATR